LAVGFCSGNIRVDLPSAARFEIDATSKSGEVWINRDDVEKPAVAVHHFRQKVNGGDMQAEVRTDSGRIDIR
jgi:Putative adhesin